MKPEDAVRQILPDAGEDIRDRLVVLIRAAYLRGQAAAKASAYPEYWKIAGSLLKAFLTALLGVAAVEQGLQVADIAQALQGTDAQALMKAAVAAVIHVGFNYSNPADPRYGVGKQEAV